jgi:Fe-S cluster biogenesis protein NfuA
VKLHIISYSSSVSRIVSTRIDSITADKQSHGWVGGGHTSLVQIVEVQTVILKVIMHCEGCAGSVKSAVKRIPGTLSHYITSIPNLPLSLSLSIN